MNYLITLSLILSFESFGIGTEAPSHGSVMRSSRMGALSKIATISRLYADKGASKHNMKISSAVDMECTSFKNDDPVLSVRMYRDRTVCSSTGVFSICNGSNCPTNP